MTWEANLNALSSSDDKPLELESTSPVIDTAVAALKFSILLLSRNDKPELTVIGLM
jgi:hypothetical protein